MTTPRILITPAPSRNFIPYAEAAANQPEFSSQFATWVTDDLLLRTTDLNQNDHYTVQLYMNWMRTLNLPFLVPHLDTFRNYLLDDRGLKATTVSKHVTCIRKLYERLIRDRDFLFSLLRQDMTFTDKKALVDEIVIRVENAIHPDVIRVKLPTIQDEADENGKRLTREQATDLLRQPGLNNLKGLRNTAMIALALATGVREAELLKLEEQDLRMHLGGEISLHVRNGKGRKTRLVPYGEMIWALEFVDAWLDQSGIVSGYIFRRVDWFRTEQVYKVRKYSGKLVTRTFYDMLESHPIDINGEKVFVRPHDLRRTYARLCYEAGMDLARIQRNLGHVTYDTTLHYIGALDGGLRRPPAAYEVPTELLNIIHAKRITL